MPTFSTIITTYNRENLIRATLHSVLAQEFTDQEVIVVDDGSTDATVAVLAEYGDSIRVLEQRNSGPGAARNLGLREAVGQYIAFLDSDDVWFPWTLATYKQIVAQFDSPSVVLGNATWFSTVKELESVERGPVRAQWLPDYVACSPNTPNVGASAMVLRADALRHVGGFTDRFINFEDWDLFMRLGTAPGFVYVESPLTYGYRAHAGSAVSNTHRNYEGVLHLIEQEKAGHYPGGGFRSGQRRRLLSRHVRPVVFECLRKGYTSEAWETYRKTVSWQVSEGRFRFLAAFPLLMGIRMAMRMGRKRVQEA